MLDLRALVKPLEPIRLRNGRELAARPLDADGWQLYYEVKQSQDEARAVELLQRILPDATADDLECISATDALLILAYAAEKIDVAQAALKNSSGTRVASTSPPSSPATTSSTSSRRSRASTAKAG